MDSTGEYIELSSLLVKKLYVVKCGLETRLDQSFKPANLVDYKGPMVRWLNHSPNESTKPRWLCHLVMLPSFLQLWWNMCPPIISSPVVHTSLTCNSCVNSKVKFILSQLLFLRFEERKCFYSRETFIEISSHHPVQKRGKKIKWGASGKMLIFVGTLSLRVALNKR